MKPILCLDFDGVIHSYMSGWQGATVIPDPPVPGAAAFLYSAVEQFRVAIYSSRSGEFGGIEAMRRYVLNLLTAGLDEPNEAERVFLSIEWPTEKPPALVSIDDRALTFDGNWPSIESLRSFQPWNKDTRRDDFPVSIDRANGTITICGVKYSFDLFWLMGNAPVGTTYRLADRRDGVVTWEAAADRS